MGRVDRGGEKQNMRRLKHTIILIFLALLPAYAVGAFENEENWIGLGKEKYYTARELFYKERNLDEAERMLAAAGEMFFRVEEGFERHYWLGRVAFLTAKVKTGRDEKEVREAFTECAQAAQEALTYDGKAGAAHSLLGGALLEQNNQNGFFVEFAYLPQAFLQLEKAVVLDPENHAVQSALAEYYIETPFLLGGHPQKAIEILKDLPPTADKHEEFLTAYRLGKAYALDGRKEEAIALLEQSLSIYSNDPLAREELAKLQAEEEKKEFRMGVYPILPPEAGFVLGAGAFVEYKGVSPYLSGSYDLSDKLFYYSLATRLRFSPTVTASLGYFRESTSYPGYLYQEGARTWVSYHDGLRTFCSFGFFSGEIGDTDKETVTTNSVLTSVAKPLYHGWGRTVDLNLSLTAGWVEEESYHIINVKAPVRYNDYRGLFSLGYISQGKKIDLGYTSPVRGYTTDSKEGNRTVLLSLERSFPLFPYSLKPYLGALQGVVFVDTGSLFNDRADFSLQKSAGVGLLYNTPLVNIRLDLAFTEDLAPQPLFAFEFKM